MSASLNDKIVEAIRTGAAPLITVSELIEDARDGVVVVDFTTGDPLGLESIYRIAALTPGVPIGEWLPNDGALTPIFQNDIARIEQVIFELDVDASELTKITVVVGLGEANVGLTLSVLDSPSASATVTTLTFAVGSPLAPPREVSATVDGGLQFGALALDVSVTAPDLSFAAEQADESIAASALLDSFGLPLTSVFEGLSLEGLKLELYSRQQAGHAEVTLTTGDGAPFPIIPDTLALQNMTLVVDHAPANTKADVSAAIVIREKLFLSGQFVGETGDSKAWTLSGALDVPATVAALAKPEGSGVSVSDLITTIYGRPLPQQMQGFLGGVAITKLEGSAEVTDTERSYALSTALRVDWELASGVRFAADTSIDIAGDDVTVTGDIDIAGFALSLEYTAGAEGSDTLHATAPQLAGLEVTYTFGSTTLEFSFANAPAFTLGGLLADFIGFVTGNPFVTLPSPWDVLGDVKLSLAKVSLSIDLKSHAITIKYDDPGVISLFGVGIDGFELGYDSKGKPKGERLSFTILGDLDVLIGDQSPSFNPEQPSSAPTIPGQGATMLDIPLVAVGQHVALPPEDATSVETAVAGIARIASSAGDDPENLPVFNKDAGWLIGAHLIFQGAVDFQMVFADPSIYGVLVQVEEPQGGAKTSPAIEALVGLRAEILYRRISDSVGVYEGHLTLPDRIRKIDYGAFLLQLPSLAVAIYTNGDFLIDIGFPHGGDFSNSLIIDAGQYTGAGGVYYGRLSGETATGLPSVPTDQSGAALGVFDPVTAIGIGLRVGIEKGYEKGPLTASFSVVVQAIFEGLFATYTEFATQKTEEYYDIRASVAIIGQLQGELDFGIITASVLVRITVSASVRAIAARAVVVPVTACVEVRVSVKIDLGLFSIRIHFSFNATVGFTATFGSNRHALWDGPQRALNVALADTLSISYAPLAVSLTLPLLVVPQLTRGTGTSEAQWIYAVQLALPAPQAEPGHEQDASDGHEFIDFVQLVAAWVANAGVRGDASKTDPSEFYASITLDADAIEQLSASLQQARKDESAAPTHDDIQQFLAPQQFELAYPGGAMGLGFFPMPPSCTVSYALDDAAATTVSGDATRQAQVLRDYILMIALELFDKAAALFEGDDAPAQLTLAEIFTQLGVSKLSAVTALTTRFMLHGTRVDDGSGSLEALYAATGQQIDFSATTAEALSITLQSSAPGDWGLVFPADPNAAADAPAPDSITLTSTDGQVRAPKSFAALPTSVSETDVSAGDMPIAASVMREFVLGEGAPTTGDPGATLRRMPRQLIGLAATSSAADFGVIDDQGAAVAKAWQWSTSVAFDVRRVPDRSGKAAYSSDTYALAGVLSDSLTQLLDLYRDQTQPPANTTPPNITKLELAWQTGSGGSRTLTLTTVEPSVAFLYQSNISTQHDADTSGGAGSVDATLEFLGRLLTGGLVDARGYYLYLGIEGGVPGELFDARGLARLMLVVSFETATGGDRLRSYYSTVRIADASLAAADLRVASPSVTTQRATVPPGMAGAEVLRPEPDDDDADYQTSLDNLFNLISFEATKLVDAEGSETALSIAKPPAIGPLDTGGAAGTLHYRHVYDLRELLGSDCPPNSLHAACNPYQFVGGRLELSYRWIDLFGNVLPAGFRTDPVQIGFSDPLANLGDWPGLSFGFSVEGGGGQPRRLLLQSTWVPAQADSGLTEAAEAQYVTIYHQLAATTVTAKMTILDAELHAVEGDSPAEILRKNIEAILAAPADRGEPLPLTDVRFVLPDDDDDYHAAHGELLEQLAASVHFSRSGPADSDFDGDAAKAILSSSSTLAPFHPVVSGEGEDDTSLVSFRAFARSFEAAFGSLSLKVLAGSLESGTSGQFYALRWGAQGLQLSFSGASGAGEHGFAPPPFATSLQSREDIQPLVNNQLAANNPFRLPDAALEVTNLDMDASMSEFLTAVERFLSPDYAIPAARIDRAAVERCIAAKQTLAGSLSERAVALAHGDASDATTMAAAREAYRQACLVALTNYYGVDAVGVLEVGTKIPADATLPSLSVQGQPVQDLDSDVSVSPGRAALRSGASVPLPISLSSRNKGWQASYNVPQTFAIEGFELVTGSISVATNDEPVVDGVRQVRSYDTGTWLRFVIEDNARPELNAEPIELPLRAYPPAPVLRNQGFSPAPIDDSDDEGPLAPIREAKSWSLDCAYRHVFTAQDTLHLTIVLNEQPATRMGFAEPEQDLLDALVQFHTLAPRIQASFDAGLLADGGDQDEVAAAIEAFVVLVEYVRDHFAFVPEHDDVAGAPTGQGYTWQFRVREHFDGNPASAPFEATLELGLAPELSFELPPPTITIDGHQSYVVSREGNTWTLRFRDADGNELPAIDGIGSPDRDVAVQPLDIIDWQNGRYYLQIIRNEGLPSAFVYTTPVVGARDNVQPFVQRTVDIDVATLPKPAYGADAPPEGSVLDWTARLLHALLSGQSDEVYATQGSVRVAAALTWPVHGERPSFELPAVRLPIVLTLPQPLSFDPSPDEAVTLARPLATAIDAWLNEREVSRHAPLQARAEIDFEVTVFSETSETGLPILRLDGLTLKTTAISEGS
jgi:hypothetical protein